MAFAMPCAAMQLAPWPQGSLVVDHSPSKAKPLTPRPLTDRALADVGWKRLPGQPCDHRRATPSTFFMGPGSEGCPEPQLAAAMIRAAVHPPLRGAPPKPSCQVHAPPACTQVCPHLSHARCKLHGDCLSEQPLASACCWDDRPAQAPPPRRWVPPCCIACALAVRMQAHVGLPKGILSGENGISPRDG